MLVLGVLHDDVVGLIPDVRAVAVGAVGGEVGVLVGVHPLGRDALVGVGGVEGVYELLHVAELDGGVVFEHLDHRALLELAVEAGHDLVVGRAALLLAGLAAGGEGEYECRGHDERRDAFHPFHLTSPFPK